MKVMLATNAVSVEAFPELTAANSKLFRQKVSAALNGHSIVEIDLSRTTFIDCAGLGALIAAHNLTRGRNGAVRLLNPTSPVRDLLDLIGVGQMFEIVNTNATNHPIAQPGALWEQLERVDLDLLVRDMVEILPNDDDLGRRSFERR